jgi:heme exporter protein CcmD
MLMRDFLAMGGYALWVWSAYALTVIVMAGNVLAASGRLRRVMARMHVLVRRNIKGNLS